MFQVGKCYENKNPATSTYIKVTDVLTQDSREIGLVVEFITKSCNTLLTVDNIWIKLVDVDNWKERG